MGFENIAATLGLEWEIMVVFVFLTIAAIELAKDFGVKGKWLFIPAVVVAFFLNLAWFNNDGLVDWKLLIFGTIIVSVVATGGNSKLKNIAHKWGRPSSKELKEKEAE